MRKIAREAVIFALLGALLVSIWFFIQESGNFRMAEAERAQADARAAASSDDPGYRILFNAQNMENETRTAAWRIFWESKDMEEFVRRLDPLNLSQSVKKDLSDTKDRCFTDFISYNPSKTESALPKGFTPLPQSKTDGWVDVPYIPAYCAKFQLPAGLTPLEVGGAGNRSESLDSLRWPEPRAARLKVVTHSLPQGLFMGLIVGFPVGLGVWLFYRLVRFAILG